MRRVLREFVRGFGTSATAAGWWAYPDLRLDLVRTGIAMYGLTPAPILGTSAELGLEGPR